MCCDKGREERLQVYSAVEPIAPSNRLKASPPALPQCGSDVIVPQPFSLFPYMGIDWWLANLHLGRWACP